MKKWFIGLVFILVASIAAIYIFIPNKLEISRTAYAKVSSDVAYRFISDESKWIRWWPEESPDSNQNERYKNGSYFYNKINYRINHKMNVVEVLLYGNGFQLNSAILILSLKKDSSALYWRCAIETGYNPIGKIKKYRQAKRIKKNMTAIFNNLQSYLGNEKNIYSIPIKHSMVTDTLLVSKKITTTHYPTTPEVYSLIDEIKQFISRQAAKETNYPMLHVLKIGDNQFETMVAIPVNKRLNNNGNFIFKRMVPGNILVAEVKGGNQSIQDAFNEMENYIKDNGLVPPAIRFESLVTNRMNFVDTASWITRLYYPIL